MLNKTLKILLKNSEEKTIADLFEELRFWNNATMRELRFALQVKNIAK